MCERETEGNKQKLNAVSLPQKSPQCEVLQSELCFCLLWQHMVPKEEYHTHTLWYLMLLRVLIARRVLFKEWIVRRGDLSVNTLSLPLCPCLHLFSSLPPSLHVPQCKIWARQPYKSGREIMRVGPLSPVGHQPGSVPVTSSLGRATRLMSAVTLCHCFWIRHTLIHTCIAYFSF